MIDGRKTKILAEAVTKIFVDRRGNNSAREVVALENVNMAVWDEEIVSIVGPSGCGKTTLLNLIAGFEPVSGGRILVSDRPVRRAGPDRALVFQQPALFPWLTVYKNVTFGARHQGVPQREYTPRALELIESVGLMRFRDHYPYQLSGGMKQRVQLARALLNNPDVLLMDEPFGPLDWQTRSEMQELLLEVWNEFRPTILLVTHDVEEAIFVSDRVYVMTRRPGSIKMETKIPFAKPRTADLITELRFVELKEQIVNAIREEGFVEKEVAGETDAATGVQ